MIQVSNQAELAAALRGQEPNIQVTADFSLNSQLNILYDVLIESAGTGAPFTLFKDPGYDSFLFRISGGGALRLARVIVDGLKQTHDQGSAANRSLIYVTGGSLYLDSGAVIQNNSSYGDGGGIQFSGNASYINRLDMKGDARVTGCTARTNGGGISFSPGNENDRFSISGQSMIDHNDAVNGGGLYLRSQFSGVGGILTITGSVHITDNTASSTGGGVSFSGYRNGGSTPSLLSMDGPVVLSGNRAVHGAGIYDYGANDGDYITLSNGVSITGNRADGNGGGICLIAPTGSADLRLTESSVTQNTGGTGGGIYLLTGSGGSFILFRASITDNAAQNGASGSGGGIWFQNTDADRPTIIAAADSAISGNSATAQGGGLYLSGGPGEYSFRMTGSSVTQNRAGTNGGGILMSSAGGSVDLLESELTRNQAGGSGGAFYYANMTAGRAANVHLTKVLISGNTAHREGGGLRFSSPGDAVYTDLTDCTVTGNLAETNSGGGIWHGGTEDHLTLYGGTQVSGNTTGDGNGGGIYLNSDDGYLRLTDQVRISGNRAGVRPSTSGGHGGGVCVIPGSVTITGQAEITGNSALVYGGGISAAEESRIQFISGSISENHASQRGGGVWNHGGSIFTMSGGTLLSNEAVRGGALYNDAGSSLILTGGSIDGNRADVGGGIYNAVQSSATISDNLLFGVNQANTAAAYAPGVYNEGNFYTDGQRDLKNGIYIVNIASVVRILGPLEPGSVIQIDRSGYVSPNETGAAIVIAEATAAYPQLTEADRAAFRKPPAGFDGWEIRLNEDHTQVLLVPVTYTIHYENLMGASNPNPGVYNVTTPDIYLLEPGPIPGYQFIGWFDSPEGGNQITVIPQGSSGDITLYARWEAVSSLTLVYSPNDACGPAASRIPDPVSVQEGQPVTLSALIPIRPCYRFLQWNTRCDGTGIGYAPGSRIESVTDNLTLYAIWEPACCPPIDPCCVHCGCRPCGCGSGCCGSGCCEPGSCGYGGCDSGGCGSYGSGYGGCGSYGYGYGGCGPCDCGYGG